MKIFLVLIVLVGATAASGCATRQESGALIGAVTGAVVGNQVGKGTGRVFATAAGAIIGGIVGSEIGRKLDEEDRRAAMEAEYAALEEEKLGGRHRWENPRSGHHGEVVMQREFNRDGLRCREYEHTIYIDGEPDVLRATSCRAEDGRWRTVG
jgi:surface antigen